MLLLTYNRRHDTLSWPLSGRAADPDNSQRTYQVRAGYQLQCHVCRDYGSIYTGAYDSDEEGFYTHRNGGFTECPRCGDGLPASERVTPMVRLEPWVLVTAEVFGIHDRVRAE